MNLPSDRSHGPTEPSDLELVEAIQRGDEASLDTLVRRYHAPLTQFVDRMLGDPETASDVVQETFLRMIRALPRYRPQAKFSTWLYTIACNLARDTVRQRNLRAERLRPIDDEIERDEHLAEPAEAVVDTALRSVQAADIRRALAALSPDHRAVMLLHYYQGLSYKEIAAVTGCTVGTVGSRLHYAIKHLRRALGAEGDGDA